MKKARRIECFKNEIKKYVTDYYITGSILIGRKIKKQQKENKKDEKIQNEQTNKPKKQKREKFSFYLNIKEYNNRKIEGKIQDNPEYGPKSELFIEKIYKFAFKQKKKNLFEICKTENEKYFGDKQYIAAYLNICLGNLLKKLNFYKDRASKKILYYNKNEINKLEGSSKNSYYLYFPALKTICETYEYGNIFMKLLPKSIVKFNKSYEYYFYLMKEEKNLYIEEAIEEFKNKVINRRGMKIYNQTMIKINDIIYENPYEIDFIDKEGKKRTVGEYYMNYWNIRLDNAKMPIAIRYVDKGGKLKGNDIITIYIPCSQLQAIGNVFDERINIKDLIEEPSKKYKKIINYRYLIEDKFYNSNNSNKKELYNYLGKKFDPVIAQGQIIKPPKIIFGKSSIEAKCNGAIEIKGTVPYNDKKEPYNVDIYLLGLTDEKGEFIWNKLNEASKELGIKLSLKNKDILKFSYNAKEFENGIKSYFDKYNDYYKENKDKIEFFLCLWILR